MTAGEYCFLALIVLRSGGVWFRLFLSDSAANYVTVFLVLAAITVRFFLIKPDGQSGRLFLKSLVDDQRNLYELVFMLLFVISSVVGVLWGGNRNAAILMSVIVVGMYSLGILIQDEHEWQTICKRFIRVVSVFAGVSLVFFFLGSVLRIVPSTGVVSYEWGDRSFSAASYFGLYYERQEISFMGYHGFRNCALFTEAPMFAFPLCISLAANVLLLKRRKTLETILLVLAAITTFSTTALVVLVVLGVYCLLEDKIEAILQATRSKTIIIGLLSAFALVISILILDKTQSGAGSFNVRLDHVQGAYRAFISSLPFGVGYGEDAIREFFARNQGISVGLPALVASTGILSLPVFFQPLGLVLAKSMICLDFDRVTFAGLFLWLFYLTAETGSIITWFTVAVLLVRPCSLSWKADNKSFKNLVRQLSEKGLVTFHSGASSRQIAAMASLAVFFVTAIMLASLIVLTMYLLSLSI